MVLNLGGFKFNWKQVGGISLETEFGISSQDRYDIAYSRQSYPLTNGNGKYFGRFAVIKISEKQAVFTPNGAFFTQSFSLELRRDYD